MKHPHFDYTTEDALLLARDIRHGGSSRPDDPMPTIKEAIGLISSHPNMKSCDWRQGKIALHVLGMDEGIGLTSTK